MSARTVLGASDDPVGSPNVVRVAAAASTNATLVKATPGNVFGFLFMSNAAAAKTAFIKFYDKASAPTVGTDTPLFTVPLVSTTTIPGFAELDLPVGVPFKTGIAYAITAGVADTDVAAVALNDVHGFILWK
jgi:hypothetical protein